MTEITCSYCHQEAHVNMYFCNTEIEDQPSPYLFNTSIYRACVTGKAICPHCGTENRITFRRVVDREDIIVLAGAIHKEEASE